MTALFDQAKKDHRGRSSIVESSHVSPIAANYAILVELYQWCDSGLFVCQPV